MKTEVVKRDGTIEDYGEDHIVRVSVASGLTADQSQTVASNISKWISDNHLSKVTSLQVRDLVLENFKKINPAAADLYLWYEQTKDGK